MITARQLPIHLGQILLLRASVDSLSYPIREKSDIRIYLSATRTINGIIWPPIPSKNVSFGPCRHRNKEKMKMTPLAYTKKKVQGLSIFKTSMGPAKHCRQPGPTASGHVDAVQKDTRLVIFGLVVSISLAFHIPCFADIEVIRIYNRNAAELVPVVDTLLSESGKASIDVQTNAIIIKDVPHALENIRKTLEALDSAIEQLTIRFRFHKKALSQKKRLGDFSKGLRRRLVYTDARA